MKLSRLRIVAILFGLMAVVAYAKDDDPGGWVVGALVVLFLDYLSD